MLLTLGYVLAGVILYEYFVENKNKKVSTGSGDDTADQAFLIKSGKGEMTLPPCEIIAVELGPLEGASKAILQIMDKECKPVDVGKEKKYVKLTSTRYQTNVYLKMKKETEMPITVYYKI